MSSASAALVLTAIYGDNYAFDDQTGSRDKLPERHFTNVTRSSQPGPAFRELYGGIHFRAAIEMDWHRALHRRLRRQPQDDGSK